MVESGLRTPDLPQWLPEFEAVPWPQEQLKGSDHTDGPNVFSHLLPVIQETLGRPSRLDYNVPLRASLFIESMRSQAPSIKRGAVAYALWMAKSGPDGLATRYVGADIAKSMVELSDWLQLPEGTTDHITNSLEGLEAASYPPSVSLLMRQWFDQRNGEQTFMDWFVEDARRAEAQHPL